jgi:nucleotide-binding universal stress UspA family protein
VFIHCSCRVCPLLNGTDRQGAKDIDALRVAVNENGRAMFNRILLPLDGSPLAECVISHAMALAKLNNAEIVPLLVLEENASEDGVDPMEWHLRKTAAQSYIDSVCTKLQEIGIDSHCLLLTGSPYQRILEQVEKLSIDLVLISSHGQSGRVQRPLGAIAHKVLEGVGTSVMLIPAQEQPGDTELFTPRHYNAILIPLDGSRRAECVLPIADWLAREQSTKLVLAHVVQRPGVLGWAMLADDTRKLAEEFVEHTWSVAKSYLAQIHDRRNIDTISILSQADNTAIELDHIAKQNQVDLVLVSAHGVAANPMRSFGDTVNGIVIYCHQPVLIYQDRPAAHTIEPEAAPIRERIERQNGHSSLPGTAGTQQAYL